VKQQIGQATAWGKSPRFLIHDNDGIFGQFRDRKRRDEKGRRYRCRLDLWLADVMGIEGIPIPYGAPNASPHIERLNRTLHKEALDHFIFLNVSHVRRVCAESSTMARVRRRRCTRYPTRIQSWRRRRPPTAS